MSDVVPAACPAVERPTADAEPLAETHPHNGRMADVATAPKPRRGTRDEPRFGGASAS